MGQPMIDIAFDILSNKKESMVFIELWNNVSEEKGLTETQKEDKIAQFYTDLSLDGRFVNMQDNKWDLKSRHRLEEVKKVSAEELIDDEEDEVDED
ncbi:DNA-directed RNA polymerase subunit delta [Breznakia sp. PF5-3]|uniref:DNA-directed RNA polymerase subunit delta n=1 Tax=unclassified Breznakia TaxID=2623764 RepID=UPI002404ACF4|nr:MULTISPECIES: DNA-directed RNA polymerase subunit delta [unclassified Breznakia]MDL2276046.1 DNA-directed RNA polymerase subunit delta [Breznakia sp. OttesenSCG-928-G09]MDF9824311.1 DNA-directed RNA polymerase subunit delta [Breznakia sp. PM6-1]MDF9835098.1 DNA-directed RNA polymerase subunit delta [Breznakia sp. PF5-3]MDF9838470.1 DNA-directed RNA polymerase subunit delta [Breznakia sp. PFB2-8]MDF9860528.1 DNA-directed RNA polymerase subunit delta [Breznakia sp. PH5-24]